MLLAFGDLHFGECTYSKIDSEGFYTAELECIKALDAIKERASQDDIDIIIFNGDFFHTNHPKIRLVKHAIGWFKEMDKLNKPFYIIPGNHDASVYSNALMFMHKLTLKNIHLIDQYNTAYFSINWNKFKITFLPYVQDALSKNKDTLTYDHVSNILSSLEDNSIVVAHIVEPAALQGSEAFMFSKKVQSVDLNTMSKFKNLIFLLGHIHRQQVYTKSNGASVVYPGSLTYNDASDLNQQKGYIVIDNFGKINLETIPNIRKFQKYIVPTEISAEDYLRSIRLPKNSVLFLESDHDLEITKDLHDFLLTRDIIIGKITINAVGAPISECLFATTDPYDVCATYVKSRGLENEQDYIDYCNAKITERIAI